MRKMVRFLSLLMLLLLSAGVSAQEFNRMDADGNITQRSGDNRNFNPYNNDSTSQTKEVPKGIYVWTVDRKFGDIRPADVDTVPHLYPETTLGTGKWWQYNNTGSNYTARQNRIFADRRVGGEFLFTDAYDQVLRQPDEWHFTNTLSPITNLSYDNCGDKTNGEDHLEARFAVNAGKQVGLGFDLNYAYARGYFQNQSTSHFGATFYTSYLGDHYQLHALFSTHHQKATENGGITNVDYITHPELFTDSYSDNEIPTILSQNWNRNDNRRLFLTHRYNLGFYRRVPLTEEELKARKEAEANAPLQRKAPMGRPDDAVVVSDTLNAPAGRPDDAVIMGDEPPMLTDSLTTDSTRVSVTSKAQADSLLAIQAMNDSIEATTKNVFVPVTSIIHTLDLTHHDRIYQAYATPTRYYADTLYNEAARGGYVNDSIYDQTRQLVVSNTVALALLEGFNRYAAAGLKAFVTHQLRRIDMPSLITADNTEGEDGETEGQETYAVMDRWTEHNVSLGGQLSKTQGNTLHYNLQAETWVAGKDAGQLKLDASADLNFPLFGDTVSLVARGYFYRLAPSFYHRHYHSKHLWWDLSPDKETRTRIEGAINSELTKTRLRVAIEEIQNYTYLGMAYDRVDEQVTGLTATVRQHDGNLNVFTAQLDQRLALGPLHWDNIITYQTSSNKDVLPLPTLNVFSNLYLEFMVAHVLRVELGAAATWFSKYEAPDFCPQLNQFAVQENVESRRELGNFPFVDAYANLHLKHARFFVMMHNALGTSADRMAFLAPFYPQNRSVLHLGVSWNFFN